MIDDGLMMLYSDGASYIRTIQGIRNRLATWERRYYVLKDRKAQKMTRYAVAVFDEKESADIDVLLMGDTLYVLAMRLAEGKWFVTKNQAKEFKGCESSIAATLPFESGYGALEVLPGLPMFTLGQCSVHTTAMKHYMTTSHPTALDVKACKTAFAYFAMTIGEAARFHTIENKMTIGGIDPAGELPVLQRWVVDSSVREERFPSDRIAVVGVHEKRGSVLFRQAVARLTGVDADRLAPTIDELAGESGVVRKFLAPPRGFADRGAEVNDLAYECLLDAYFTDRLGHDAMETARSRFEDITRRKNWGKNNFSGLKFS